MSKAKGWGMLFLVLAIAGGANWVTVGLFNLNLVSWLFNLGGFFSFNVATFLTRAVEVIAGGSAIALLWDKF